MINIHSEPKNSTAYDLLWDYQEEKAVKDNKPFSPNRKEVVKEIINPFLIEGKDVLDLCCGRGRLSAGCFDWHAKSVTAVDGSYKALLSTENNLKALGYNPDLVQVDLERLDEAFDEGSFDIVIMLYALQHLKDPKKAIQDMARISKDIVAFTYFPLGTTNIVTKSLRKFFLQEDPNVVYDFLMDVGYLSSDGKFTLETLDEAPEKYAFIVDNLKKAIEEYGVQRVKERLHFEDFTTPYLHNLDPRYVKNVVETCGLKISYIDQTKVIARK